MTWPILENFDELTPPALPSDLTVNAGTWTSESTYSVSSPNGLMNTGSGGIISANVDGNSGNVSVSVSVLTPTTWPTSTTLDYAVFGRCASGVMTASSYAVVAQMTSTGTITFRLSKYVSGTRTDFSTITLTSVPGSTWLTLGLDASGSNMRGWVQGTGTTLYLDALGEWSPGPATPDGTQPCFGTVADTAITGAGYCGVWSDTGTGYFDNLAFQNTMAPSQTTFYTPSNGTYLSTSAWSAAQSYPFWFGAWISTHRRFNTVANYPATFSAVSTTALSPANPMNGYELRVTQARVMLISGDGTNQSDCTTIQAPLTEPYWDHILAVCTSPSSRSLYLNGVLEGTDTATINTNVSGTGPLSRIGISAYQTTDPFTGGISNVTVGNGTLSSTNITDLATVGYNYATIPGITNWYPLSGNANDSVGTANMTVVGSPVWQAHGPYSTIPTPTQASYIAQVFGPSGVPTDAPVVTTGVANPMSNVTGYASIETLDVSYTLPTNALLPTQNATLETTTVWTTRAWHFIAPGTPNHVVFWDDGHGEIAEINEEPVNPGSGGSACINALLAAGYSVVMFLPPGYDPTDPIYPTSDGDSTHDYLEYCYTPWFNPLSLWLHKMVTCMNNIAPRYPLRSVTGLSGGGWQCYKYAVLDSRINHACIPIRGALAHRRAVFLADWEQLCWGHRWNNETLFYHICCHRVWMCSHPNDTCCFGIADPVIGGGGVPGGAYQNAANYAATFLAPVAAITGQDMRFFEDQGTSFHSFTPWAQSNVILPALSAFSSGGGSSVTWSHIQGAISQASSATQLTLTATFTSAVNAGDLIVVSAGFYFTTGQTITVKDNVNSTNYTYKGPTLVTANQNLGTWIYTTPLGASANAFTVTLTVSEAGSQGPYLVLGIDEFSCGSGYTYSIDGSPGYQSSGGTNSITLASSLAVTGTDLIYAAAVSGAAGVASADSGTGWTLSENAALISSQSFGLLTEYLLNDTTSVNPIVTSTTTVLSHLTGIAFLATASAVAPGSPWLWT